MTRHGTGAPSGRLGDAGFDRLFGYLPVRVLSDAAIEELADALTKGRSAPNRAIRAGYTYFGQFVDHDVTFDATSILGAANDPRALPNLRTPRLDLDSLYGAGPLDQPFLYESDDKRYRGVKLLEGRNPGSKELAELDLPRNSQGRALLGDPRNDENQIVSQLHLLFIRFHNRVVERLDGGGVGRGELFERARQVVRWHYQWIAIHDFLPKLVGNDMAVATAAGRRAHMWRAGPMPVEFSAAAFRFGHSMVREDYDLNATHGPALKIFSPKGPDLRGFAPLPADREIEWHRFFPLAGTSLAGEGALQESMRIDPFLTPALSAVPPDGKPLAWLNLRRGAALGLPSGRDVAAALGEEPLSPDELLQPFTENEPPIPLSEATQRTLVANTPLWYYVLCEAMISGNDGRHLGPVGGRIVAEVMLSLLENDPDSYVHQEEPWPLDLRHDGYTMRDLIVFATSD